MSKHGVWTEGRFTRGPPAIMQKLSMGVSPALKLDFEKLDLETGPTPTSDSSTSLSAPQTRWPPSFCHPPIPTLSTLLLPCTGVYPPIKRAQLEPLTEVVAVMGAKEEGHAPQPQVALPVALVVKGVDLGVGV